MRRVPLVSTTQNQAQVDTWSFENRISYGGLSLWRAKEPWLPPFGVPGRGRLWKPSEDPFVDDSRQTSGNQPGADSTERTHLIFNLWHVSTLHPPAKTKREPQNYATLPTAVTLGCGCVYFCKNRTSPASELVKPIYSSQGSLSS